MSSLLPNNGPGIFEKLPRVCLPYGLSLFDLCRWMAIERDAGGEGRYVLFEGARPVEWNGEDEIDLFNYIQRHCLNYKLASTYVMHASSTSLFFFDQHERFSFFASRREKLRKLYPFSYEIVKSNFLLSQEEDDDFTLDEIFQDINTA